MCTKAVSGATAIGAEAPSSSGSERSSSTGRYSGRRPARRPRPRVTERGSAGSAGAVRTGVSGAGARRIGERRDTGKSAG